MNDVGWNCIALFFLILEMLLQGSNWQADVREDLMISSDIFK